MADLRYFIWKRKLLILHGALAVTIWCDRFTGGEYAWAEEPAVAAPPVAESSEYHTPLAGQRREVNFLGQNVLIPGLDRAKLTSVTLGFSFLDPPQGKWDAVPVGALYLRRISEDARFRGVISVVDNELEYDKRLEGPIDLVGYFTNYTIPLNQKEVVNNRQIDSTSMAFGDFLASVGPGLRIPVAPAQVDNDLRLQLMGRVGYFFAKRSNDPGVTIVTPPDTALYGVKFRGRYDCMLRNLLELPHKGFAFGWDLDYTYRDNWRNLTPGATGSGHRDYLQASGYFAGAAGLPGLSERDRMLFYTSAGTTTDNNGDRYNAFRINGGPIGESDDFARPHYTGAIYTDVRATSYATATLGYRRELTFFLYLSLLGSYIWGDRATVVGGDQVVFRAKTAGAGTVSLDSAFLWDSELYLNYTWESSFIRNGSGGNAITLMWNKMF